jgi:hypothetical protein
MVATVCQWHEHHVPASAEITARLQLGDTMVIAAHAILEAYSVLTRFPPRYRLTGIQALTVLTETFLAAGELANLDAAAALSFLKSAPQQNIVGGQVYDGLIAATARYARVDTLLTFNVNHYLRFAGPDLEIKLPGS